MELTENITSTMKIESWELCNSKINCHNSSVDPSTYLNYFHYNVIYFIKQSKICTNITENSQLIYKNFK
jgi:hypothetical protein